MKRSLVTPKYLTCDVSDTLTSVIGKMKSKGVYDVLCYKGKKYMGMLDPHMLLKIHMTKEEKAGKAVRAVKRLALSTDSKKVASDLLDNHCHALPVVEKGKVLGVVKAVALVESLLTAKLSKIQLQKVASMRPLYFFEDTPIGIAMPLLRAHNVDHAPIVDVNLRLTGIVSIMDLVLKYHQYPQKRIGGKNIRRPSSRTEKRAPSGAVSIGSVASPIVATGSLTDSFKKAVTTMKRRKISSVVLTDKNNLVGIVTISDLLRVVARV